MSSTLSICPNSSKKFLMSDSFQLLGKLPAYTITPILLDVSYYLVATGESDLLCDRSLFLLSFRSSLSFSELF